NTVTERAAYVLSGLCASSVFLWWRFLPGRSTTEAQRTQGWHRGKSEPRRETAHPAVKLLKFAHLKWDGPVAELLQRLFEPRKTCSHQQVIVNPHAIGSIFFVPSKTH